MKIPRSSLSGLEHYRVCFDVEMGKRFRHARANLGMNQCELASWLGVSHDHIRRIESGETQISRFNALAFHTVFRGRTDFILFSVDADRYGYRTPEELIAYGKACIRMAGGRRHA